MLIGLLLPVLMMVRQEIGAAASVALTAFAGAALGTLGYWFRRRVFLAAWMKLYGRTVEAVNGSLPSKPDRRENPGGRFDSLQSADSEWSELLRRLRRQAWQSGRLHLHCRRIKEGARDLYRLAYSDPLTGLPNRRWFINCATSAIAHAAKSASSLALVFMDLDCLKETNDTLGHSAGDCLIQSVAVNLNPVLDRRDLFGRIGGDEFCLLIRRALSPNEMLAYVNTLRNRLSGPVTIDATHLNVSASFGISRYPQDGLTCAELLRHADSAMYSAKRAGKNGVRLFHADADSPIG